ncbi:hypothetical protein EWB00_000700 [Schistosoma japonicum]|uniref:Uncharacterized protein n=1 Tax=Schistosoma japonicum TaxID=6182 RepID=A0A4Z2CKC9_SCHJA|nr:hypothetical protein EWB00_000700 [Schistosoma japonicum]
MEPKGDQATLLPSGTSPHACPYYFWSFPFFFSWQSQAVTHKLEKKRDNEGRKERTLVARKGGVLAGQQGNTGMDIFVVGGDGKDLPGCYERVSVYHGKANTVEQLTLDGRNSSHRRRNNVKPYPPPSNYTDKLRRDAMCTDPIKRQEPEGCYQAPSLPHASGSAGAVQLGEKASSGGTLLK